MSGELGAQAAARAEQARQTATALVHAVYRLVKSCALHSETNQAVVKAATGATVLVADLAGRAETDWVTALFTPNAVFVNGRMLKMTRDTFALAAELGTMLEVCEVNELSLAKDVPGTDLARFARMVAEAQRDRSLGTKLREAPFTGVRLRKVKALADGAGGKRDDASPTGRAVKTFAQAVIVMRDFYAALRAGDRTLPNRVKRVAQKLVAHAEDDARRLVTLAVSAPPEPGHAGVSVSGAVVAIAMGRQLTNDRRVLGSLAQAALLYDAGRARLLGEGEALAAERALSEDELDRTPASEIHVLTAIGRIHQPAMARNVIAYEALRLRRRESLGLAYGGRRPTSLAAHVLAAARAFVELRSHQPGTSGLGIDEAIQLLLSRADDAQERTVVKLLVGALGIFPAGTLVELSTGEQAVVLATPAFPADFARPPVRVLYDAKARLLDVPFEIDLAAPPRPGDPPRLIRRTIDADESQMKAMRAYVASSARRRTESLTPEPTRRTYDQDAPTDVVRHARAEEAAAHARSPFDATTPASVTDRGRGAPSPDRDGPPTDRNRRHLGSPPLASARVPSAPSSQDPRSPVSPPRPIDLRDAGPVTPSPRTLPPVRYRSALGPSEPPPRSSEPGRGRVGVLAPSEPPPRSSEARDGRSRLGTPDRGSDTPRHEAPAIDTGLPISGPSSSRARPSAWEREAPRSESPSATRAARGEPIAPGGARTHSPAAGLRIPEPPQIYETPTRAAASERGARAAVEYEEGGATRQASWDEVRDLLDVGAPTERSSAPTPPRRSSALRQHLDGLSMDDELVPSSGRGAARVLELDASEPTRIGGGSVHDRLLAAYLADDPVDEAAPRAERPTPRATPVRATTPARAPVSTRSPPSHRPVSSRPPRAPAAPAHGLRWTHDDATPEPAPPSSSRGGRSITRPDGK